MDYKEQAALIRGFAYEYNKCSCITKIGGMKPEEFLLITATAITDLLSRAEAAEARLRELVEADRDGRCVVLPAGGHTEKDGENALKSAMNTCFYHNNPVTRYIADAVAEKLTREAADAALKGDQHG